MIPSAPKFGKIILLLKDSEGKPTERLEYLDSAIIITGNYVIITEENSSDLNNPASVSGKIYEMKDIHSYKLFKN
jgi:hypothetical protein